MKKLLRGMVLDQVANGRRLPFEISQAIYGDTSVRHRSAVRFALRYLRDFRHIHLARHGWEILTEEQRVENARKTDLDLRRGIAAMTETQVRDEQT